MLWKKVARRLTERGYPISYENCDRKWRNLKNSYKKILYDTGRNEKSKCQWEYYTKMQVLFSENTDNKQSSNLRKSRILPPPQNEKSKDAVEDDENQISIEYLDEESMEASDDKTILGKRKLSIDLDDSSLAQRKKISAQSRRKKTPLLEEKVPQHFVTIPVENILIDVVDEIDENDVNVIVAAPENSMDDVEDENDNKKSIDILEKDATPPVWFQNFMTRYDSDNKILHDKFNQILDGQSFAKVIINNLNNKVNKLTKKLEELVQER